MVVGLSLGSKGRARTLASVEELADLVDSAGARVVATVIQERARRDPATLIGRGKLSELQEACDAHEADVVVFDDELSPAQQRNVEGAVGRKTVDRTQLILDIFARRARTREGRLQVELAQLDYLLPRLAGKGILLSRLGGGIGTRGPGETKLETDRRRIRQRIQSIKRDIERVRRERATRREARTRRETPVVGARGLHERREVDAVQRPHARRRRGLRPAVHDPRPAGEAGEARRWPRVPARRHRRLHPEAAALAGGRLPGDARRGHRGRPAASRGRRLDGRRRGPRGRGRARCCARSARRTGRSCWC